MTLMNTQSNASGVSVECVALCAALQLETLTIRQMLILDYVLDILKCSSLGSLQRRDELDRLLTISQKIVQFEVTFEGVPLDPRAALAIMRMGREGSSKSTMDKVLANWLDGKLAFPENNS
jgi:hypothetical protein